MSPLAVDLDHSSKPDQKLFGGGGGGGGHASIFSKFPYLKPCLQISRSRWLLAGLPRITLHPLLLNTEQGRFPRNPMVLGPQSLWTEVLRDAQYGFTESS